jgi:hypothetical protein
MTAARCFSSDRNGCIGGGAGRRPSGQANGGNLFAISKPLDEIVCHAAEIARPF